jgi:hypothetical protein
MTIENNLHNNNGVRNVVSSELCDKVDEFAIELKKHFQNIENNLDGAIENTFQKAFYESNDQEMIINIDVNNTDYSVKYLNISVQRYAIDYLLNDITKIRSITKNLDLSIFGLDAYIKKSLCAWLLENKNNSISIIQLSPLSIEESNFYKTLSKIGFSNEEMETIKNSIHLFNSDSLNTRNYHIATFGEKHLKARNTKDSKSIICLNSKIAKEINNIFDNFTSSDNDNLKVIGNNFVKYYQNKDIPNIDLKLAT